MQLVKFSLLQCLQTRLYPLQCCLHCLALRLIIFVNVIRLLIILRLCLVPHQVLYLHQFSLRRQFREGLQILLSLFNLLHELSLEDL